MSDIGSGEFQINDIVLKIPPEQIHVERLSANYKWQTLRTRSSIKTKSGYSTIEISFNAKFTDTIHIDGMNGYHQLQALIAQFRCTPFCYIENQTIRDAILGSDNQQTMALALKQMEIRKDTETTNVIEVFFSFVWFNYFPFSRNFSFKRDIFLSEEEANPSQSLAWKRLWKAEMRRGKYGYFETGGAHEAETSYEAETLIEFRQYAQLSPGKYNNLQEDLMIINAIRDSAQQNAKDGQGVKKADLSKFLQAELGKDRGDEFFNLMLESNTSFFDGDNVTSKELLELFNSSEFGNAHSAHYNLPSGPIEDWKPIANSSGEIIKFKSDPVLEQDIVKEKDKEDTKKDIVILERPLQLHMNQAGLIVTGISISFENILAVLPLTGHPYPTYQHIGSIDAVVTISMMTTHRESIQALSEFYSIVESQALKFKLAPQGQRNVWITDPIVNACGLYEFMPESVVIDTVPGQPGTYSASLQLVDNPISSTTREEIIQSGSFITTQDTRMAISKVLTNNLKTVAKTSDGWFSTTTSSIYTYSPRSGVATDTPRDQRFKDLCEEYGRELTKILKGLEEVAESGKNEAELGQLNELYVLENKDVLAIERLQEDLFASVQANMTSRSRASIRKSGGIDWLRMAATSNISRSNKEMLSGYLGMKRFRENLGLSTEDQGGIGGTTEGRLTVSVAERNIYWLNRMARFIKEYLGEWLTFSNRFIDRIMYGSAIELDQFENVRKKMVPLGLGVSGHCYPDFPLQQVIDTIQEKDISTYQRLVDLASQMQLPQKRIPLSAIIGPDFYFYNDTDSKPRLITSDVMTSAKNAIVESQSYMEVAERSWIEQGYEDKYLGNASKGIKERLKSTEHWDKMEEDEVGVDTAKAMKRLLGNSEHMAPDDLQADGVVHCSLADSKNSDQIVSLPEINNENDPNGIIGTRRSSTEMQPVDHYAEVQHRFGADAIDFVAQSTLYPSVPSKKEETPTFGWPTYGGKAIAHITSPFNKISKLRGGEPHKGIDIVAKGETKDTFPTKTIKMDVIAAADGRIIKVTTSSSATEGSKHSKNLGLYWRRKGEGDSSLEVVDTVDGWERVKGRKPKETTAEIVIDHDHKWKTVYKHMQWDEDTFREIREAWAKSSPELRRKDPMFQVQKGDKLGKIGTSGYSTGPHLHFETRYDDGWYDPEKVCDGLYNKVQGPVKTLDPNNESLLTRSMDQLEKELVNGQAYTMARAYPTFRLYFIESDMGERKRFAFDDFFSYSSVKSIQVIRNRKIAADLCMLQLTNISGALSNRKFRSGIEEDDAKVKEIQQSPGRTNTKHENQLGSLMLQPGMQLQLRLGYNNNPEELEKVFNGVITDIQFSENDDLVLLTCQSFAIELTQVIKGDKKKSFGGFLSSSGRTANILEQLIASPEVVHFGRWDPAATSPYSSVLSNRWKFTPSPEDDNIFAPTGRGWRGIFDSTAEYKVDETTIWDVFQEMTLRHPGYIAMAVPYEGKFGPRMTMFFGCPEQPYFARSSTFKEDDVLEGFKKFIKEAEEEEKRHRDTTPEDLQDADKQQNGPSVKGKLEEKNNSTYISSRDFWLNKLMKNYALDKGIVKPFRAYHVLTSTLHILYNNITSSTYECFNTASISYSKQYPWFAGWAVEYIFGEYDTFTLKCDAAIPDEEVREVFAQYSNCLGEEMAKRYAVGLLFKSMKEGYKGSIVSIGNPSIKPYDICYVFDEYSDMFGPVEVEQVVHSFSQETGFITEITPDMVVHVNRLSTLTTSDAMGLAAETALKKIGLQSLPSVNESSSNTAKTGAAIIGATKAGAGAINTILEYACAPIANMFYNSTEHTVGGNATTNPGGLLGIFIFRKLLTRSQLAHPMRYSPLVKNGKPMLGGLPNKKLDGSFIRGIRKWVKEADEGIPLWLEDTYDRLHPRTWWSPSWGSFSSWLSGTERHGEYE